MRHASALATAAMAAALAAAPPQGNYLLIDSSEIASAKSRALRYPWAKQIVERIVSGADAAIAGPLEIPERGGQWTHWYSCPKDGARLSTQSRTEHRCTLCGTVYTGEPYDSVVLSGIHSRNGAAIRDCGLAYCLTGEERYARLAARLLVGYADRYRSYPRHDKDGQDRLGGARIMAQTLDEAVWLIPVSWGFAMVRDVLSPLERAHVESDLLLAAADVIREHKMGVHNIQCWKNSAVGLVGYATGRDELVREAIEDPDRGFLVQIQRGVTEDGLWWEGSLGYHQYTMQALWPLAEAARHAGRNLYSERLRTLWDAPLAMALPNGDPAGFNDSPGSNVSRMAELYEIASARWDRSEYRHLLSTSGRGSVQALLFGPEQVETGASIPATSSILRDAGFAVLRAGTTAAAVRFGRHGGGHGHPDKLNLVTFAGGRTLGLDPGSINYGVPLHREWYRSTIAHNTVSVDGQIQAPVDGRVETWGEREGRPSITMAVDNAYAGVSMHRILQLTGPDRLHDRFECRSESQHVYDWAFHVPGELSSTLDFQQAPLPPGTDNGYQHIKDVRVATSDLDFSVTWKFDAGALRLDFAGSPGTVVFAGRGPGRNPSDSVPVVIVRRKAQNADFEVVHRFEFPRP